MRKRLGDAAGPLGRVDAHLANRRSRDAAKPLAPKPPGPAPCASRVKAPKSGAADPPAGLQTHPRFAAGRRPRRGRMGRCLRPLDNPTRQGGGRVALTSSDARQFATGNVNCEP
jgi:hypothetical protein